jgi:hypothetical protein
VRVYLKHTTTFALISVRGIATNRKSEAQAELHLGKGTTV